MNPVNIAEYISLISALLNVCIGLYLFSRNPRKTVNRIFLLFVLSIVIFNIGEMLTRLSTSIGEAIFWGGISYSVLWLGSSFVLHFSLYFPRSIIPEHHKNLSKYLIWFTYFIGLIVYILFIYSLSVQNIRETEWGYRVVLSSSSLLIIIWFLFIIGLTNIILAFNYLKGNLPRIEKKQIKIFWLSSILVIIISFGTNLIPPLYNYKIFPMTSLFTTIFIFCIAYAIIKYKFLALSPIIIAENILDTMKDSLIVVNEKGYIVDANKSTTKLLHYNKNELLNCTLKQIIRLPESEKKESENIFGFKIFDRPLKNKWENIEVEFINKEGKVIPMNITASFMYDKSTNLEGIILVARDLTETKRSLREKEVLLREIHHRVKNNLQLISSLLDLQSEQIKNKDVMEIFRESQNRIRLMAKLHEQLYQSKNLANINFKEYVQNLTADLFYSYNINPIAISIKVNIPDIFMDVDTTLDCGLIINELVVNSLKHAFSIAERGEIIIDFHPGSGNYRLVVSDNGAGFPKKMDFRNTKTLGLQLVNMLVQQLKGTIELDRTIGTKFIITFQLPKNKKGEEEK
jgi:PAS domain S-box-containing protein